jgi:probable HAF family extracellular repeat protein
MQARWTLAGTVALTLAVTGHTFVIEAAGPVVGIEDLGPSNASTYARGVNANGVTVGFGFDAGTMFAFSQGAVAQLVAAPAGTDVIYGYGVNDLDVVTGYYTDALGTRAYRYDASTATFADVPFPSGTTSAGYAINQGGVVVGYVQTSAGARAFRHQPGLVPEVLPDFGGVAAAFGVNDAGVAVGEAFQTSTNTVRAFRYDGTLHPLASLGGTYSRATAINTGGTIVGYSMTAGKLFHATRWRSDALADDLGTLGGVMSMAFAVNGKGEIVGRADTGAGEAHAFLLDDDGMTDLNSLLPAGSGWLLQVAYGINDSGVIVGEGKLNGQPRAFRLTLAPASSTDTVPPVVTSVSATPGSLWPPKHQMVTVQVAVNASDDSGETPTCEIVSIGSSDPDNGTGDGDTPGDVVITGPLSASLRAERSGPRDRVYTLTMQCVDGVGNSTQGTTSVVVPKSAK